MAQDTRPRGAANAKLTRERWSGWEVGAETIFSDNASELHRQEPPSCNLSRSPSVGTYVQTAAHTTEVPSNTMANITDCGRPNTGTPTRDEVSQSESSPLSKDASVKETHSRIGALPDEILLRILECLPDVDNPRSNFTVMHQLRRPILDYASIALTCRSQPCRHNHDVQELQPLLRSRSINEIYQESDHQSGIRFIGQRDERGRT